MKSMQRFGGKMMKRSADQQDVGALGKDLKAWRDGWDDVLKLQYNATEAFANLYKPIEPTNDASQQHVAAITPQQTVQKCLALQKLYSDMKDDLQQEITMIGHKILRPVEDARMGTKALHKTLKHRENMKLDYERYLSRAEHARKKGTKSPKEEAALAKHESDLQQAQIDYQTADDQVVQTFPPVTEAVLSLLPYLLANQVRIQTTMVGQIYTSLDQYCRSQQLGDSQVTDGQVVSAWDQQFTGFRKELESGLQIVAGGKAIHQRMDVPDKESGSTVTGLGIRNKTVGHSSGSTVTGLGLRNKTAGLAHRNKNDQALANPGHRADSAGPGAAPEEEEIAPPKPPRPGTTGDAKFGTPAGFPTPSTSPGPSVSLANKPRMPSYSNNGTAPYGQNVTNLMPGYPNEKQPPPPYSESSTPPSRYQTPVNGVSPHPSSASNAGADYFDNARRASAASFASSAASVAAAKKKPPPPVPAKRLPSQQTQFVTALFDFEGQNDGDLAFREGDRIRVVKKTDSVDDWWDGELNGRRGAFPANYVQL